jgi:histidinol-phosphate phosphatase family protein
LFWFVRQQTGQPLSMSEPTRTASRSEPSSRRTAPGPWVLDGAAARRPRGDAPVLAVLFDRDGTLVEDVPYNGDPDAVLPLPGAREAVSALRARGTALGVVSNQSGVARGLLTRSQVLAVRRRVDELFGPFDVWAVCPHGPDDGCPCRKPAPGLVLAAAARLGVEPARVVVVGDIGADVEAAAAAGARAVLVPTCATRAEEVRRAPALAPDLPSAVRLVLSAPHGFRRLP